MISECALMFSTILAEFFTRRSKRTLELLMKGDSADSPGPLTAMSIRLTLSWKAVSKDC